MEFILLGALFAIFDAIRRMNKNVMNQTEELRKIRAELEKQNRNHFY